MMSSAPTRGHNTLPQLPNRFENTNDQPTSVVLNNYSSEHPLLNPFILSYVLPFAATELTSPFIFNDVCTAWAVAVTNIYCGGAFDSWKFYFEQLRKQDPEKAEVQLMKLLKFSFDGIVKSPKDCWSLDCIFVVCDELQFRINSSTNRSCGSIEAACNSLTRNDELTKNYDDFKCCFFNFCRLFRGQSLTIMLCGTLRACLTNPSPHLVEIAKTIIDNYNDFLENALVHLFDRDVCFDHLVVSEILPPWFKKLKKMNKLRAVTKVLLRNISTVGPFLHHATRCVNSAEDLQRLLSILKEYLGTSLLRKLFSQMAQEGSRSIPALCYALTDFGVDFFSVLIEAAWNIIDDDDEFFVDLCFEVDDVKGLPLFALACSMKRRKEAEIILRKIGQIRDPSLVRRFVEGHQRWNLDDKTRELLTELLKKENLIEVDDEQEEE